MHETQEIVSMLSVYFPVVQDSIFSAHVLTDVTFLKSCFQCPVLHNMLWYTLLLLSCSWIPQAKEKFVKCLQSLNVSEYLNTVEISQEFSVIYDIDQS